MSAAIVTEFSRDAYDPARLFPNGVGGDVLKRIRPGQLWERVAETPSNAPAPLTALGDAIENYRGRPVCIAAQGYQGPVLGRHVCGDHHSHGIIRAGVRVK